MGGGGILNSSKIIPAMYRRCVISEKVGGPCPGSATDLCPSRLTRVIAFNSILFMTFESKLYILYWPPMIIYIDSVYFNFINRNKHRAVTAK